MKKILNAKTFSQVLSCLMAFMAAFVSGGMAMAVTIGEHGKDVDPNSGNALKEATKDSPDKGIDLSSHAATGSAVTDAEFEENQIDDYVSKFRAHRFPLHTDFMTKARQIKVDTKEPANWEIGEAILEAVTTGSIGNDTVASAPTTATLPVHTNDAKLFLTSSTILVEGVTGADDNPLVLYVDSKSGTTITVSAINGPKNTSGNVTIPAIASGTTLYVMAPALSESEIEIEPDNALPLETQVYLQKKVCAITYTELFNRIKKKAKWNVQDLKDAALDRFRRKCTRSMLISAPAKFYKENAKTGVELCYTQEGILRQMRLGYQLSDGQIDFSDLIAISAMMFGKYETPNELTAYCGTKFIQRLLNIDFTGHNEYTVRNYTDETTKIKITSFESNFGKINFVHEYGLDDLGYGECAIIFAVEEAKRFVYQPGKTITVDHEKGEGGQVREAKSEYYVQDDCMKLGGFNNMIVGPATLISGYTLSAVDTITSVNKLSDITSPAAGQIAYLIADLDAADGTNPTKMGLYKREGSAWVAFDGKEIYV